jgi:hypothetical protein
MTVAPYGAHEYDTIAHSIAAGITSGACWLRDNFVQTVAGKGWFTYFRLYGPTQPYFDRSWVLPDIERV